MSLEQATLSRQDVIYAKHVERYGPLPGGPSQSYRQELLRALQDGDVLWLQIEICRSSRGDWDFVFPPSVGESDEGWCRSPLSLLVRPNEGALRVSFLRKVPRDTRLQLVHEALRRGVCSPHFEGHYWSCPAIHAALLGDAQMLAELHAAGLDMQQVTVEWNSKLPSFTVLHAAAINGHVAALRWLVDTFDDAEWLQRPDGQGQSALFHAIRTARSREAALLLASKCDPFKWDPKTGKSPFSVAVEFLPEVAEEFLNLQTRQLYALDAPAVRINFEGLVVCTDAETRTALRFTNSDGQWFTLEGLVAQSPKPELAAHPVLARLSAKKWEAWAGSRYWTLLAGFASLSLPYMLEVTVGRQLDLPVQCALLLVVFVAGLSYYRTKVLQIWATNLHRFLSKWYYVVDIFVALLLPIGIFGHACDLLQMSPQGQKELVGALDAFLSMIMCLRLLRFFSVFSEVRVGAYLNSVIGVLRSALWPLIFLAIVISCFGIGFLILFGFGAKDGSLIQDGMNAVESADYIRVVEQLVKWLFNPPEALKTLESMRQEVAAVVLFLFYYCVAVLGSLRLLTDSANATLSADSRNVDTQWLDVRARVVDEIEQLMMAGSEPERLELDNFYRQLPNAAELVPDQKASLLGP